MNIKDVETQAIARQLAAATGESITLAVTTAIRERLHRVIASSDDLVAERKRRIFQLAAELRENAGSGPWPDHGDLLYGAVDRPSPA